MIRRSLAIVLAGTIVVSAFGFRGVSAQNGNETEATQKIRAKIQKIGVGPNARVEVKLRDNTQLRGYLTAAQQDSFSLTDNNTGSSRTVSYAETSSVKKTSGGWGTKNWLILGGVAVGAIVTWAIVKPALCDGGAQTRGPC